MRCQSVHSIVADVKSANSTQSQNWSDTSIMNNIQSGNQTSGKVDPESLTETSNLRTAHPGICKCIEPFVPTKDSGCAG